MEGLGLDPRNRTVFETWHAEEIDALTNLFQEPPVETLKMEYYLKLVDMFEAE